MMRKFYGNKKPSVLMAFVRLYSGSARVMVSEAATYPMLFAVVCGGGGAGGGHCHFAPTIDQGRTNRWFGPLFSFLFVSDTQGSFGVVLQPQFCGGTCGCSDPQIISLRPKHASGLNKHTTTP